MGSLTLALPLSVALFADALEVFHDDSTALFQLDGKVTLRASVDAPSALPQLGNVPNNRSVPASTEAVVPGAGAPKAEALEAEARTVEASKAEATIADAEDVEATEAEASMAEADTEPEDS